MVLVSEGGAITKKSFDLVQKQRVDTQVNLALVDVVKLLESQASTISDATTLSLAFDIPFEISSKKSNSKLTISFSPVAGVVDINKIGDKNKTISQQYLGIIHNFLESYDLGYIEFYEALLLDTIDKDKRERELNSEIVANYPYFTNGKITDIKQIEFINRYYYEFTEDETIFSLPWQEVFGVGADKIDINYVSFDLLKAALPKFGNLELKSMTINKKDVFDSFEDMVLLEKEDVEFLKSHSFDTYVPVLKCNVVMEFYDKSKEFSFVYNLEEKNVANFKSL
jgi:hypothetical protein